MTIPGVKCDLSKEATIVLMKGTDGMYYAQSASLCKANNPYTAVRRCLACMKDYAFARRYDMYQNGEITAPTEASDIDNQYAELCKRR